MLKIRRTDNFDIVTPDPEKLATWYHETLGLPWIQKWDPGLELAAVTAGDLDIFFLQTDSKERGFHYGGDPDHEPGGHMSLGFEVEDCEQAVKDLGDKVKWVSPVHHWEHPYKKGWSYSYVYFYDPEGNMLHLTEPRNMPELESAESSTASGVAVRRAYESRESLPPKR
jgi:isopenicillin-N N-acyltransferase-like protein